MEIQDIKSIGWLNCADGTVNLTPVFNGCMLPVMVNISREEFEHIRADEGAMKRKALMVLNGPVKTDAASYVLELMDTHEDGQDRYMEFVRAGAALWGISVCQLNVELEPFV